MEFIIYDIAILICFAIFVSIFLYNRRENLKKEGLLLLYKSNWGIKVINLIGNKYKKTLKIFSYVSIAIGYVLMITMVYLFGKIILVYLFQPEIVRAIKIPPIMPLIPYLPKVFNLTFLPPFYFIYWIIIIAIIAIPHELMHGIYSAYNKIKIKSTGFGFFPYFFPVFLAAFVEPDEKKMFKKNKFSQLSILSSGTFANILTAVFFFFVMWGFFAIAYTPVGVIFDSYSYSIINLTGVPAITINNITLENISYDNILDLINEDNLNEVNIYNYSFIAKKSLLEDSQSRAAFEKGKLLVFYDDAPAIRAGLTGAISEINGVKIDNREKLAREVLNKNPGEIILVKTYDGETYTDYNLTLEENPAKKGVPWLGIGFVERKSSGVLGKVVNFMSAFKKPEVYYQSDWVAGEFIYNLLWWILLISISVALVNMLPIGIFDGGRFFYLTILAITKSEKIAKKSFLYLTYLFLLLLALIMFFWVYSFL